MKILISLLFTFIFVFAASKEFALQYGYTNDYQKALQLSKQTNKQIMLMISTESCPWCRKLESSTLRNAQVNNYIQKNYIPMSVIREVDTYPSKFKAPAVPAIYFIDSSENETGKIIGYKPPEKFLEKLKDTSYSLKPIIKTSPFLLTNIKELNVKFVDKSKSLNKKQKQTIKENIAKELQNVGIKTKSNEFANIIFKIESLELEKTKVFNITLRVVEDVIPKRDKSLESIAIVYYKNDMFELEEDPISMVNESIFKYLLPEFVKQYKDEN